MAFNLAALAPLAGIGQGLDAIKRRELQEQQLIRERAAEEQRQQQRLALPLVYRSLLGGQPRGQGAAPREFSGTGTDTAAGIGALAPLPGGGTYKMPGIRQVPDDAQTAGLARLPMGRATIGSDAGVEVPGFGQQHPDLQVPDADTRAGAGLPPGYPSPEVAARAGAAPPGYSRPTPQPGAADAAARLGLPPSGAQPFPSAERPLTTGAQPTQGSITAPLTWRYDYDPQSPRTQASIQGGAMRGAADDPQHTQNLAQFGIKPEGGTDPNHKRIAVNVMDKGQKLVQSGAAPREVVEASTQNAYAVGKQIDPRKWGYVGLPEMVQMIERTAPPGTPDIIKAIALGQLNELLAPADKQAVQSMFKEHQEQARHELAEAKRKEEMWKFLYGQGTRQQQADARAEGQGWDIINFGTADKPNWMRVHKATGQQIPLAVQPEPGTTPTKIGTPGRGGQDAPLSDATAERYAKIYEETGYLPPGIARSSKAIAQIMNKTGATGTPGDFVANVASRQADTKSLANMQKIADAAIIYENTAIRNFDQAMQYADKGISTDWGPWVNRWIATGRTQFGDENVPPYVTALLTAANEYAKVMTGSTGAAAATEGARREVYEFFSPYLNKGQIREVITVAKQEMENRKEELLSGIDDIKNRLRTPGSQRTPRGHTAGEGGAPEVSEEEYNKLPSGAAYRVPGDPAIRYKP